MSYLILADYFKTIQSTYLDQITGSSVANRTNAELAAQAECVSHLTQKYDTASEFTDTAIYAPASALYKAASRVYLDAPAYNASGTYAIGALTLNAGNVYICIATIGTPEVFTPAHWTLLGTQYQIFYAQFPNQVFDQANGIYAINDLVFWKGHNYKCKQATIQMDDDTILQYQTYENIPSGNVFPDQPVSGPLAWLDMGAYTIPAGSLLNTTYFTPGDNRNQQMVMFMIDIALYHIHARISTMNVPEVRYDRYRAAINWLKASAKGDVTAALTKIQPLQGQRIRAGGNIKQRNSW